MNNELKNAENHLSKSAFENLKIWFFDERYKEFHTEIEKLIIDEKWEELEESFFKVLEFGTAGRRGKVGVGPNRINLITISESAQALADYLKLKKEHNLSVAIGWDVRNSSKELSRRCAEVLAANQIKVFYFDSPRSTPELSFTVRELKASAGIVISASHNPPQDNGIKVYWDDGAQVSSPNDKNLMKIAQNIKDIKIGNFEELKQKDIEIVVIDPIKSETVKYYDKCTHIPIRPNTDVAMMLGMAHYLYTSGKYDKDFIESYTYGFDKFLPYLLGQSDGIAKTPEWASEICKISADTIRALADKFKDNRTMLISGWSMQRAHHGEQPHWMLIALASMIGQIGLPGGGFGYSYHYANGGVPTCKGGVITGINKGKRGNFDENGNFIGTQKTDASQEWEQKAKKHNFPAPRIAEMLLNPGKVIDHNGKKITYADTQFIYFSSTSLPKI